MTKAIKSTYSNSVYIKGASSASEYSRVYLASRASPIFAASGSSSTVGVAWASWSPSVAWATGKSWTSRASKVAGASEFSCRK